jgi:hypothetical protein
MSYSELIFANETALSSFSLSSSSPSLPHIYLNSFDEEQSIFLFANKNETTNGETDFQFDLNDKKLTVYEIWGIIITLAYFILGFPTNLLSIIVYVKLQTKRFHIKQTNKKIRRQNRDYINSSLLRQKELYESSFNRKYNKSFQQQQQQQQQETQSMNMSKFGEQQTFSMRENGSRSLKNRSRSMRMQSVARNSSINPHRQSFELYLIELSVCDLIIITYNFVEWSMLFLSQFNYIDQIYSEPILISQFMCRFIIALNRTIILLRNWLMTSMAMTRLYVILKNIYFIFYLFIYLKTKKIN